MSTCRQQVGGTIATVPRATNRPAAMAVLLHGEERFLVDEKARAILQPWVAELVSDFGLDDARRARASPPRASRTPSFRRRFSTHTAWSSCACSPRHARGGPWPAHSRRSRPRPALLLTVAGRLGGDQQACQGDQLRGRDRRGDAAPEGSSAERLDGPPRRGEASADGGGRGPGGPRHAARSRRDRLRADQARRVQSLWREAHARR